VTDNGGLLHEDSGRLRRRFLWGATWLLAGSAAGRLIGLIGTVVVTRLLLPRGFGQLSLIQIWVAFLAGVAGLGMNVAITKTAAAARATNLSQVGRLIGLAIRISALCGGIVAILVLFFRGPLAEMLGDDELVERLGLASLAVAAGAISSVALGALSGLEAFRPVAIVTSVRSVISAALMVIGASWLGVSGAVAGWMIGECVAAVYSVLALTRCCHRLGVPMSRAGTRDAWGPLWRIGIPALAANVAVVFGLALGQRLLAEQPLGYQHVAEFNLAYRWSLVVLFIPASITPVLLPLLSNLRATRAYNSFVRLLRTNLWLTTMLTALPAGILVAFREVVLGLSGSSYESSSATFVLLMLATVPTALNSILSNAALSLDAVRAWLVSDVALAVTVIGLGWVLIPRDQSAGLALAYASGYVVTCIALVLPIRTRVQALEAAR